MPFLGLLPTTPLRSYTNPSAWQKSNGHDVAIESQLTTDVAQANNDASTVRYDFSNVAERTGIRKFGGVGLAVWG